MCELKFKVNISWWIKMKSEEEEELTWSAGGEAFLFFGSSSFLFAWLALWFRRRRRDGWPAKALLRFPCMLLRCPLFLPLFRVFSCWFLVFFSYVLFSGFWFLIWVQLPFFFSFSVQFPQFFFFVCVSAQSSLFKTKTNGGKSTRICCWLSDQKFP